MPSFHIFCESCEGVEQVEVGHAVHLRSLCLYGSENVQGLYASDRSLYLFDEFTSVVSEHNLRQCSSTDNAQCNNHNVQQKHRNCFTCSASLDNDVKSLTFRSVSQRVAHVSARIAGSDVCNC